MSDSDPSAPTRDSEAPQDEASDAPKSGLSELLRVGSDENAMLLGATPESQDEPSDAAGSKDSSADEAKKPATETSEAPAADAGDSPAAEASSGRARQARPPERRFSGGLTAGLAIAVAGLLLLVAPTVSTSLSQTLARVLDPHAYAGVLVVGGLLLATSSVVQRHLRIVQDSLDVVGRETARLEKIAENSRAVLDALHTVRIENTSLAEDVVKLQVKIKRLTDIVSNPDYAGSIFRLAASVDLLGKHVEVFMRDQFATLQQRLTAVAQQAEHTELQLKSALGQVQALTKEQLRVHQLAVQEGFAHVHTASDKTASRIEQGLQVTARIESSIQSQQQALANGWASLSDRLALSVSQVSADLSELRASIDRRLESGSASLHARFEGLDDRIGHAERSHVSGIQKLSEQIQGHLAVRMEELQQGLKLLADVSSRTHKEIADDLGLRLDKHSREQQSSLQQVRDRATEATRAAKGELASILEQLRAHLEQLAREHRENMAALHKSSQESQQSAGASRGELSASLEQIGSRLEQSLESRTRSLASDMMGVAEMIQAITAEVRSCIAESILRVTSVTADSAASRGTTSEWPRIDVPNPDPEGADGWPVSVPLELGEVSPPDPGPFLDPLPEEAPPSDDGSTPPPEVPNP